MAKRLATTGSSRQPSLSAPWMCVLGCRIRQFELIESQDRRNVQNVELLLRRPEIRATFSALGIGGVDAMLLAALLGNRRALRKQPTACDTRETVLITSAEGQS